MGSSTSLNFSINIFSMGSSTSLSFSIKIFSFKRRRRRSKRHRTNSIPSIGEIITLIYSDYFPSQFRFASPRVIIIYLIASSLIFLLGFITPVHQWLGGRIATIYIEEKQVVMMLWIMERFNCSQLETMNFYFECGNGLRSMEECSWLHWLLNTSR